MCNDNPKPVMKNNDANNNKNKKYGENVPTAFAWITPEEQKARARELAEKT